MEPNMPQCPQCGNFHPPIMNGAECPMKSGSITVNKEGTKSENLDLTNIIMTLKNIVKTKISKDKIKDPEKLFKNVIVEVAKYVETYKEV